MSQIPFTPRPLVLRAKEVAQLLGRNMTASEIKIFSGKTKATSGQYHMKYSSRDVESIRKRVSDSFALRGVNPPSLPPILLSRMSRGGVGKSTITSNLALAFSMQGYRTLVIDGDPQGSLSTLLGVQTESENLLTLMDVIELNLKAPPTTQIKDVLIQPYSETPLFLIPADLRLCGFDATVGPEPDRDLKFNKLLRTNQEYLSKNFDIILIDSAPGSNTLNFNLMLGATILMGVVALDGLSLKALHMLSNDLASIYAARDIQKELILIANGFSANYVHSKTNLDYLKQHYADRLMKTTIPHYVGFNRQARIAEESHPLLVSEPSSAAGQALLNLSRELALLLDLPGSDDYRFLN